MTTLLPFSFTKIFVPCQVSVAGRCRSTHLMSRFSSYSSSLLLPSLGELDRREDQEEPEDVEDPAELVDRGRSDRDEDRPHHQGEHDADQQRLLLVLPGHPELRHDDDEDEQVVDRERVLRQPPGVELHAELVAREDPDAGTECDGQAYVEGKVGRDLLHRGLVRAPADDEQVEHQHRDSRADGGPPDPGGHVHGKPLLRKVVQQRCMTNDPEVSSAHFTWTNGTGTDSRETWGRRPW